MNITKLHHSCRGPLVIYSQSVHLYHRLRPLILQIDDNDPLKYLYDIDDGKGMWDFSCLSYSHLIVISINCYYSSRLVPWSFNRIVPESRQGGPVSLLFPFPALSLTYDCPSCSNPDSTTINGLGRWSGHTGELTPLAVIKATPGKRHRYRIVSTSCNPS